MTKSHKNKNLGDKKSITTVKKRHKNVYLGSKKLQHSEKKSQKCKFK